MWRRILAQLRRILGPREREPSAQDRLAMEGRETQALCDGILRHYLWGRFGSDESRVGRILAAYEDWLMTAEMRLHVVSVDEARILLPIRLLDALAAELGISPIALETPPWAVDDELDARHRRSPDPMRVGRSPDTWLQMLSHERGVLRELAVRHGLTSLDDRAT